MLEIPPINGESVVVYLFLAIAQVAIFGQGLLTYLAGRSAKAAARENSEVTKVIAKNVNGHLDDLKSRLFDAQEECTALKIELAKYKTHETDGKRHATDGEQENA